MAAAARLMRCGKTESQQNLVFLARVGGAAHQITGDEKEQGGGAGREINSVETGLY